MHSKADWELLLFIFRKKGIVTLDDTHCHFNRNSSKKHGTKFFFPTSRSAYSAEKQGRKRIPWLLIHNKKMWRWKRDDFKDYLIITVTSQTKYKQLRRGQWGGKRKAITRGGELVPQYSRTVCYSKCSNRQDCGSQRRGKTTFCYKPCSSITFKKATNWADQNGGWMNDCSEDEKQRNGITRFSASFCKNLFEKKNIFVVYVSKLSTKSVSLPDSDHVQYFLIWVSCSFIYKCFGKKTFDFHSAEPVT